MPSRNRFPSLSPVLLSGPDAASLPRSRPDAVLPHGRQRQDAVALQRLQHPEAGPGPTAAHRRRPAEMLADALRELVAAVVGKRQHGLLDVRDPRRLPTSFRQPANPWVIPSSVTRWHHANRRALDRRRTNGNGSRAGKSLLVAAESAAVTSARISECHRPDRQFPNAFALHSQASNELRAQLLEMVFEKRKRKKKSALWMIGEIEAGRLVHDRPADEPRHPDLASGRP